jgi:uncharacterized membrane protein
MTDLVIAMGLVAIVLVMFFMSHIGVLPKKSWPFVAGALLGIFGWTVFRERRRNGLMKELKKREDELKTKEEELKTLAKQIKISEEELERRLAGLEDERAAYKKATMLMDAVDAAERERVGGLSKMEIFYEYDQKFGSK